MKKIAWLIPRVMKGSGGHRTIIQHINLLVSNGYKCDIYVKNDVLDDENEIKKQINEYYMNCDCDVYKGWTSTKKYDIVFATSWDTVRYAKKFNAQEKFYFVQDYEPYFFPMSDDYLDAESTYEENFKTITIGRWLSYKLSKEFNVSSSYYSFCADLKTYKYINQERENAICAIFQPNKSRRCSKLLISALKLVNKVDPNIKIYLYGSKRQDIADLDATNLGIISPIELNELYNKCKLGISMSSSNPSRIPFEMMASGLPVIDLYRENNLYDMPDKCVLLSDSNALTLASAILDLYYDEKTRKLMSINCLKYMQKYPLEKDYEEFISSFNKLLDNKANNNNIRKIYNKEKYTVNMKYFKDKDDNNSEIFFVNDATNIDKRDEEINNLRNELNMIINSKRWKLMKLICSPFDTIRKAWRRKNVKDKKFVKKS